MRIFNLTMIIIAMCSFFACNLKKESNSKNESTQVVDYIINEELSSDSYSDIEGYAPKEGLVPTAEIAFQIAETVLNNLYGSEIIEKEKPFSINLESDKWIIEGTLYHRKGGVAYIEIKKQNGEIVKVLHGK